MLFIEENPERARAALQGAWQAYHKALLNAGVFITGHALQPASAARTVRRENGVHKVQDGPFADTREQLGGYIVVDVPSHHEALDWAARSPAASYGTVEIRPMTD
jgi:hypothetical protein